LDESDVGVIRCERSVVNLLRNVHLLARDGTCVIQAKKGLIEVKDATPDCRLEKG